MFEAKTNLSKLVNKSLAGEEVLIANRGKPVVKLVPVSAQKGLGNFSAKKKIWTNYDEGFSDETETQIEALFSGSDRVPTRDEGPGRR